MVMISELDDLLGGGGQFSEPFMVLPEKKRLCNVTETLVGTARSNLMITVGKIVRYFCAYSIIQLEGRSGNSLLEYFMYTQLLWTDIKTDLLQ